MNSLKYTIAFQLKAEHMRTGYTYSCDLDLGPTTLIYEFDLDILKTYLHTESELSSQGFQKL